MKSTAHILYDDNEKATFALGIESPPSEKHLWTTVTLESRSFAVTRPLQVISIQFCLLSF